MKNVHKKGGSESESPSGVKRGRPPGTKNFDETKVTHGAGICPHCEKVRFEIEFFLRGPFIKDVSSNFSFLTPPTYPCLLFLLNNLIK